MIIAVLSDIHGNITALNAVLDDCKRYKVDRWFVLGDVVGYYYWPAEVLQQLALCNEVDMIQGNHERLLKLAIDSETERQKIRKKYGSGIDVAIETLSDEQKNQLCELPLSKIMSIDKINFLLCHGSPFDGDKYIYPNAEQSLLEQCSLPNVDFVFMGHTHYPFVTYLNNCILANPGSVGQPRDIGNLASYLIVDTANKTIVFRRVAFDAASIIAEAAVRDTTLPYLQHIFYRHREPACYSIPS